LKRNASQVARAPGAVRGEELLPHGHPSLPALMSRSIAASNGQRRRPRTRHESVPARAGKLLDGFLDVFGGGHVGNIAFVPVMEKGSP